MSWILVSASFLNPACVDVLKPGRYVPPWLGKGWVLELDEIPPQNLAYAVAVLMDKFLTVSGRPSNITASANVTLGASDMSPDQVRSILKGATKEVKKQPKEASKDKVTDITPNDNPAK